MDRNTKNQLAVARLKMIITGLRWKISYLPEYARCAYTYHTYKLLDLEYKTQRIVSRMTSEYLAVLNRFPKTIGYEKLESLPSAEGGC